MKQTAPMTLRRQQGAATLLIALVLMMAITVVTLSVARSQVVEQKIANNESWHLRLSLQAEAALARAIDRLNRNFGALRWTPGRGRLMSRWVPDGDIEGVDSEVLFSRPGESRDFIGIEATAMRGDYSGLRARASQVVRPLSALTPLAENAPPLVVNGCVTGAPFDLRIRPREANSARAGDAAWVKQGSGCPALHGADTHGGRVVARRFGDDFWSSMFSVDRQRWSDLVEAQNDLAGRDRIYRSASPAALQRGRWAASLGTPRQPVILNFPAESGCPRFAPGVRIYGVVFIDAACAGPLSEGNLEIFGSLFVNGNLDVSEAKLRLNHIQVADSAQSRLVYPVLRTVAVPGTWRDFR